MEKQELGARLDEGLERAQAELADLPGEYAVENWERHKKILKRIRGLSDMRSRLAKEPVEHDPRDEVWRKILY